MQCTQRERERDYFSSKKPEKRRVSRERKGNERKERWLDGK